MRKTLSLIVCLILLVSMLGGCTPAQTPGETTAPAKEHVLKVGYGSVNATPDYGVPVAGMDTLNTGEPADDAFFVTCVALTDENDTTVLLYHLDLVYPGATTSYARGRISKETGVPVQNIILATTHNHSAPALDVDHYSSQKYAESYKEWMVEAAVAAMDDRKPAKTYITSQKVENSTFVRHFILNDGSYVGWAKYGPQAVSPLYDADSTLQLIKFTREGGKDVILMNWQGHPMSNANNAGELRSDVDVYRRILEKELDCHFAYFLGASGDVAYNISVAPIRKQPWYTDDYVKRGTELAQHAITAAGNFREVKTSALQLMSKKVPIAFGNGSSTLDITTEAIAFGDIAFAIVPYEMFSINGSAVKAGSPFEMTFVSTCTNGYGSYVVAEHAYDYDCYERSRTNYVRGSAEKLADEYVAMLKQLHGTN